MQIGALCNANRKRENTNSDTELQQKVTKLIANYRRVDAEELLNKEIF
jgi:hypothetical protein